MKIVLLFVSIILARVVYCSGDPAPTGSDDYLNRLKVVVGVGKDVAYLDLRKVPENDTPLPFRKEYIFLNGDVVVECTAETLIFECILGAKGLSERSSFKLTNIAEAFARQKLSVRGIKLRMAHWLESEQHRFINKTGLSSQLKRDRDLAKSSNVFGLYLREEFLESCREIDPVVSAASSVLALLLLESLLNKDTLSVDPVLSHQSTSSTVNTVMADVGDKRKQKAAERKKRQKKRRRDKRQKMLVDDQMCQAEGKGNAGRSAEVQKEDEDGISDEEGSHSDPEVVLATAPTEAVPLPKAPELPSSGCVSDLVSLMIPNVEGPQSQGVTHTRRSTVTKRSAPIPSVSPTRSPKKATPPSSPPKSIYALEWGGVKDEYLDILEAPGNYALLRNFQDFLTAVRASGIKGMKGVEKLVDGTFSYRLNDYYRVVFSIDDGSKVLTILSGIEHYS